MRSANHDAAILAFIQTYNEDPDDFGKLTLTALGRVIGMSATGIRLRLDQMRDCGILTWTGEDYSSLQVLNADLSRLKTHKPVGKPRQPRGTCTYQGCHAPRHGDQWCYEHERKFVERYRAS